ncbi:MAG TPA: RagB/SusD family nutrient uptake outer membrane protein, partial [Chitinophagaceae bacterium]|nr:RagB/SusD family nutrient uptake outer membrane protein [Chitinophagaceae bacterium]
MKPLKLILVLMAILPVISCTKLEEKLNAQIPFEEAKRNADIAALLKGCYDSYRGPYQDQTGVFSLADMSADNAIGPTRGGDWDDNGVWRVLHTHTWNAENQRIRENFNNLLQIVFNTTNIVVFDPPKDVAAEAKFLRAYAMFTVLDLYDQVPVREPGENLLLPSKVLKGTDALTFIINDLNAIMPDLGDGPPYKANKWAAKALLMKCYLNKGVYANRLNPTFAQADMDQVIALGNEITNSGRFNLEANFFTNFAPNNSEVSKEILFANQNIPGGGAGNVRFHAHAGTHYNQQPSGWNGFTTIAEFYDKFEATDQRRGAAYPGFTDRTGMRVGFLIGQQYDENGVALTDRGGKPLVFTREVAPIVTGDVETPGIRVVKYPIQLNDAGTDTREQPDNDYVLLRFADVRLMLAEAHLRKGAAPAALLIVNELRATRGASPLG